MVTNVENQADSLRKRTKDFYKRSIAFKDKRGFCPVRDFMSFAADKWSMLIIYNLAYHNVLRFNEFKRFIPDVSSRMLSVTLKRLENAKVISRKVYPEVPPRVEYTLTEFGKGLADKMIEMTYWVTENYEPAIKSDRDR